MDVASSPPSHGSIHDTPPADPTPIPPPPQPASHQRRHRQYSPVVNARRRSPNRATPRSTMSHISSSPPALASSSHPPVPPASYSPPPPNGQDHDRMETDEDSDRSDSEMESEDQDTQSISLRNQSDPVPEVMDVTPDGPLSSGGDTMRTQAAIQVNSSLIDTSVNGSAPLDALHPPEGSNPWPPGPPPAPVEIEVLTGDVMLDSGILRQELDEASRRTEPRDGDRDRDRDQAEDDGDEGSDSDESMDEADNPYWANFPPDTSIPDESELASIEEAGEVSGTDHDHWESSVFEALDDPEYVPLHSGRLEWTVTGNHGTPDKPNRKQIMRSPSVCIGGLYWNIKYFPRGNDGTDYMSVYVECSPKPYESIEEVVLEVDPQSEEKIVVEPTEDDGRNSALSANNVGQTEQRSQAPPMEPESPHQQDTPSSSESEVDEPWSAAAQVACVVYNPNEPRVNAHQQSSHQYYNGNPDWGWTRFHGPWSEIHTRRRNQRKPLLQADTLGFTVYIRIFKDHTKSLWWHPSDSHPVWDSVSLLGLRGLKCRETQSSAMVAAVSAWIHLANLVKGICSFQISNRIEKAEQHLRPALKEFQEVIQKEALESSPAPSDVSLGAIATILGFFYGSEIDFKKDVIIIWENLRRILQFEARLSPDAERDRNIFDEVALLKQPDPFQNTEESQTFLVEESRMSSVNAQQEPASVQEALDSSALSDARKFKLWDGASNQIKGIVPAVLQIELHRQSYDTELRKWKKLTHQISLDEKIQCNRLDYTLYGMIVHRGGLDYSEYYSVLRPDGPDTRWIKYAGEATSRSVEVLTRKAAVEAHEGGKDADESAAVAYIVIYVRSDRLDQILSTTLKTSILQESRKRKSDSMSTGSNDAKVDRPISFRVGNRRWRSAHPIADGKIYESIRETSHLSRAFYRTEDEPEQAVIQGLEKEKAADSMSKANDEEEAKSQEDNQPSDPASQQVTAFVRIFDHDEQSLGDARVFLSNGGMNVIQTLKEQVGVKSDDEPWDFYLQQSLVIKSKNLVKRSASFFDISHGDKTWDGMLFIAQRRPTPEETRALEVSGKCATPIEYSQFALGDFHPALHSTHLSNHYFTYPYLSVPLSYGRPHGQGTHIALSGSAYEGPFRCGSKAGPNGTMRYANGDTYVGDWAADEPDGQGTMTYAKTGNVYKGGWRKRRRFGKGEMKYEIADEEMMLCEVCYERNMDAVFCFCGHVIACEECARRVEYCPVCREIVKRVVVLKGPLGSQGNAGVGSWGGGAEGGGGMGVIP